MTYVALLREKSWSGAPWIPERPTPCAADPEAWSDLDSLRPSVNGVKSRGPLTGPGKAKLESMKRQCKEECPFTQVCLERALAEEGTYSDKYRFGLRGGLTPSERAVIARGPRKGRQAA